MTAETHHWYR